MSEALNKQVAGDHYRTMKIQPAEFIHANLLGFLEGSVIKYVCRHQNKNGLEDLEKAKHFLEILIDLEYSKERQPAELVDTRTSAYLRRDEK